MKPRASVNVVGVGIDLVEVERVAKALARTPGLVDRLFTPAERAYGAAPRHPAQSAQRFAARFAAKEAAMKALGVGLGGVGWHDIEIERGSGGEPIIRARGHAGDLAGQRGGTRWLVSLSHTSTFAEAIVLLTR
ncbi:MAG TPA: holo-ACP synthase [Acidimicrobiales bacterium]|nr:holo-ACP synthase [Acidimicrobiales bacterium]